MKDLAKDLKEVYVKHRTMFTLMVVVTIFSIILFIYSIVNLHPNASVVKVSYGDIGRYQGGEWSSMSNSGGYHDGPWQAMLVYPMFALLFGILHNVIALRIFRKKGDKIANIFLAVTIALILFATLILWRLLGEG
ncbi:MAG: hypothetical protein ACFNPW_01385 [Candidatus Nanosyncoccus sp.]|jgi:hypothetical protein